MNNYKTYACVRISATIKIVKLAIKTLHLIVVAHIRSQTTLRWRPKGSGILPKRTSALRKVGLTSRVLDDVGGHADGGVDRRSRKPRNNFYKRSHIGFFSIWHAYLYYGISVKRMHTQGVRIHSTPRIHSFSKWGVGVVHSFFGVVYGVGVNPFYFSVHSPLLLFWILEILLENRSTLSHKNFKCQLLLQWN